MSKYTIEDIPCPECGFPIADKETLKLIDQYPAVEVTCKDCKKKFTVKLTSVKQFTTRRIL